MSDKAIKGYLMQLGLTDYESKVYLSLLKKNAFSATALSQASEVPRTRIYEVLENLSQKGLCTEILGSVKEYRAVSPDRAIERLLEKQKSDLRQKEDLADSVASSLLKLHAQGLVNRDPADYVELYREPRQVGEKFVQLLCEANREILVCVKPPFVNADQVLRRQNQEELKSMKRGVTYQALYEARTLQNDGTWQPAHMKKTTDAGGSVRIIEELPLKMAIFDESEVIFAMEDFNPFTKTQTSLVIKHHALATTLKLLFNCLWATGADYRKWWDHQRSNGK